MEKKKGTGLKSLKGRVLLIGIVAICSAMIIGIFGVISLKKSVSNNEIEIIKTNGSDK